jgi:hypothetical protein
MLMIVENVTVNVVNRIFLPRFGLAGSRSIRGRCSSRQIQKLYLAVLGPEPVDGDISKFMLWISFITNITYDAESQVLFPPCTLH